MSFFLLTFLLNCILDSGYHNSMNFVKLNFGQAFNPGLRSQLRCYLIRLTHHVFYVEVKMNCGKLIFASLAESIIFRVFDSVRISRSQISLIFIMFIGFCPNKTPLEMGNTKNHPCHISAVSNKWGQTTCYSFSKNPTPSRVKVSNYIALKKENPSLCHSRNIGWHQLEINFLGKYVFVTLQSLFEKKNTLKNQSLQKPSFFRIIFQSHLPVTSAPSFNSSKMLRTAKGTFLRVTLKFRKTRGIRIGFEDHQPPEVGSFRPFKHLEFMIYGSFFWTSEI